MNDEGSVESGEVSITPELKVWVEPDWSYPSSPPLELVLWSGSD